MKNPTHRHEKLDYIAHGSINELLITRIRLIRAKCPLFKIREDHQHYLTQFIT